MSHLTNCFVLQIHLADNFHAFSKKQCIIFQRIKLFFQQFNQVTTKSKSKPATSDSPPHHDDVIKWKHFPRNWPFVREIHRFPVNFPHKGQWRGALMFSLIYAWINDWVNNREACDLRRQHGHYDVIVLIEQVIPVTFHATSARITDIHRNCCLTNS